MKMKGYIIIFILISFIFGFLTNRFFNSAPISLGYAYILSKNWSNNSIKKHPKGKKIKGVKEVIVRNGMVFGTLEDNRYFYLKSDVVKYFDSYEDQLRFAREKGVSLHESDYISFL